MYQLMNELEDIGYFDKDIYSACFTTLVQKKRIQNITFFSFFAELMKKYNEDPKSPFFKKLDDKIQTYKDKHYNVNREWRYDWNGGRMKSLQELIDRRE